MDAQINNQLLTVNSLIRDNTPGCFVCGGKEGLHDNIAAFVQCKESGQRILNMFSCGARLDYREFEPDRVQVKIGACKKHLENLKKLDDSTKGSGIITEDGIKEAKK